MLRMRGRGQGRISLAQTAGSLRYWAFVMEVLPPLDVTWRPNCLRQGGVFLRSNMKKDVQVST